MCEIGQPDGHDDAVLVDEEALTTAIKSVVKRVPSEGFTFVKTEPVLSAYCRAELLQVLGKLAISGASSQVVRGVGADIHGLITVVAAAMKAGYSSLLEDFLPEFAVSVPEPPVEWDNSR
jgi:hypothetical protein